MAAVDPDHRARQVYNLEDRFPIQEGASPRRLEVKEEIEATEKNILREDKETSVPVSPQPTIQETIPLTIHETAQAIVPGMSSTITGRVVTVVASIMGGAGDGTGERRVAGPPGTTMGLPGTAIPGTDLPGTAVPGTDLPGTAIPGFSESRDLIIIEILFKDQIQL